MATHHGDELHANISARGVQLVIERVYPVLGAATTQALLTAAVKEVARVYPFLSRLPPLGARRAMPARIQAYFPEVPATELALAMDALLGECIAAVRELTGDIMLNPLFLESTWCPHLPEQ